MNLPNLPTDNLYKFMALSGLAILIFTFYFPLSRMQDIQLKTIGIESQIELMEFQSDLIENDLLDTLVSKAGLKTNEIEEFRNYLKSSLHSKDTKIKSEKWDKYKPGLNTKERASFHSRELELRKNIIEVHEKHKIIMILFDEMTTYKYILWILFIIGIIQSVLGFGCWYFLIQKPNDMLLKKQIKSM